MAQTSEVGCQGKVMLAGRRARVALPGSPRVGLYMTGRHVKKALLAQKRRMPARERTSMRDTDSPCLCSLLSTAAELCHRVVVPGCGHPASEGHCTGEQHNSCLHVALAGPGYGFCSRHSVHKGSSGCSWQHGLGRAAALSKAPDAA